MSYQVDRVWRQDYLKTITSDRRQGRYLFVKIAVRNDDKKPRQIPPFALFDAQGSEYEEASEAWSVDGAFGILESLNPDITKGGILVFDAPSGRGYKLKVDGGFWSSGEALIAVED